MRASFARRARRRRQAAPLSEADNIRVHRKMEVIFPRRFSRTAAWAQGGAALRREDGERGVGERWVAVRSDLEPQLEGFQPAEVGAGEPGQSGAT